MCRSIAVLALAVAGCAHVPLASDALASTKVVAIVARVAPEAGPSSTVFRDDGSYRPQLSERKIDAAEGDRRLTLVLTNGSFEKGADGARRLKAATLSRFALADSLRAEIAGAMPARAPWTRVANPAAVARQLESLLVQDAAGTPPDYHRLSELGVDTVVEVLVESYGMRSDKGRAGLFLVGTARCFKVDGPVLYVRRFFSDDVSALSPHLDPFVVAKNASLFGDRLQPIIGAVAAQVAADLNPGQR